MRDVVSGLLRPGHNLSSDAVGSIHDDATAHELGFRGGTVAADIHLDQFAPLLVEVFGPAWFERGSLSLSFRHATVTGELVVAHVECPSAGEQVRAWMTTVDDTLVCEGTAALGASSTWLRSLDLRAVDPSTLRVLRDVHVGEALGPITMTPRGGEQTERLRRGLCSEPLDWYARGSSSPWGRPIASPLTAAQLLHWEPVQGIARRVQPFVGMFGAAEIAFVNGPVFVDETYTVTGEVVALSDSPRTEVLWYDTQAHDSTGRLIATCRMSSRILKASSPLYVDAVEGEQGATSYDGVPYAR